MRKKYRNVRGKGSYRRALLTLVLLVVLVAGTYCVLRLIEQGVDKQAEAPSERGVQTSAVELAFGEDQDDLYIYMDAIETYLIMGTDKSGNSQGEGDEYIGDPSDFMMLLVIDRTKETYGFIQLDRNTMMQVPMMLEDGTSYMSAYQQLCLAHCYGKDIFASCENTAKAVSRLLGRVPISGYYSISMDHIGKLNSVVGGVEVTIDEDLSERDPDMTEGTVLTLNDKQAEIYVRSRVGLEDDTNATRMDRQKIYIEGFYKKAMELFEKDNSFATDAYEQLEDVIITDLPGSNVSKLANKLAGAENLGIFRIEGETVEKVSETDGILHEQFLADEDSIVEIVCTLYSLERYQDEGETEIFEIIGDEIDEDESEDDTEDNSEDVWEE